MSPKRWRLALAALVTVGAGVSVAPVPAGAVPVSGSVTRVGWWTDRAGAQPSTGGGFEVALDKDGAPQSVAAIVVDVDPVKISKLSITLTERASVGGSAAHLRVCRVASGWAADNPGPLAAAPKMDCAGAVDLVHVGTSWQGGIAKLVPNGGKASLGIVGVRDKPALVNLLAEITGVAISGSGTLDSENPAPVDDAPVVSAPDSVDGGTTPLFPDYGTPAISGFDSPVIPAVPPAGSTTQTTLTLAPSAPTLVAAAAHRGGPSRPWLRLLFLIPLSGAIGVGLVFARRFLSARGMNFS
jgi:hypothetical protein